MVLYSIVFQAAYALPIGSVRDFDVVTQALATVDTYTATVRATRTVRPGLNISLWVENGVWDASNLNGLNSNVISDRQFVLDEFADWLAMVLIPKLEGSYFNIEEVNNSPSPGLNILFLDIEDDFKESGSFIGSFFNSNDQNLESGLNGMNLIYVDVNPGTLGLELYQGVNKRYSYIELVRSLSRLIQYQKDHLEDEWIREGVAQQMVYRLLNQEVFPNSLSRIINAPQQGIPRLEDYLNDLAGMRAEYELDHKNINRISIFTNPRDPRDNRDNNLYRSFHYLFFSYIFHLTGGSFQTRVTDGDRFFRDLILESNDGLAGLRKILTTQNVGTFEEIYVDFLFSIMLNTTESRYSNPAISSPDLEFTNYDLITTIPTSLISRLPSFGVDIKRVLNNSSSDQHEINMIIPAGLNASKIFLLRNQANNNSYVEKQFDSVDLKELVLPDVEKRVLIVNLDGMTKDFLTQLTRSDLSNSTPIPLEFNSSQSIIESTGVAVISEQQVSAIKTSGISGTINLNLPSQGVFSLPLTNESTLAVRLSLPVNLATTAVKIDFFNETSRSVNSLVPVTNDRLLILNGNSRVTMIFINENVLPVNIPLTYDLVSTNLYSSNPSESILESDSDELTQAELEKIAGGGAGGCFVATASFGSIGHPFVRILCAFRDEYLLTNTHGQKFVEWYYRNSPSWAIKISNSNLLIILCQFLLLPLVLATSAILHPIIFLSLICLAFMGFKRLRQC